MQSYPFIINVASMLNIESITDHPDLGLRVKPRQDCKLYILPTFLPKEAMRSVSVITDANSPSAANSPSVWGPSKVPIIIDLL